MGQGSGWGRREGEGKGLLCLPWQDSERCETITRRWSSLAARCHTACSCHTLLSCPCTSPSSCRSCLYKNLIFPGSPCFSCTGRNAFHYRAGRQEPTHPGGREQAGEGHGTTDRWDTDGLRHFGRASEISRRNHELWLWDWHPREPLWMCSRCPSSHITQHLSLLLRNKCLLMAGAVDWFKNTWSQLKTEFMWQQLWQNCSSSSDGCLDVKAVLKESPTQCRGTHQTLTWWEVSSLLTQASQKPELSFCICLIKTSLLSYTDQFSFLSFWMMSKREHLSSSRHSCEIPLTGDLQTHIPQPDEYSQN